MLARIPSALTECLCLFLVACGKFLHSTFRWAAVTYLSFMVIFQSGWMLYKLSN
jgi:hypothetical protein